MSKRAYGSAFRASPPHGMRVAANGLDVPQPQVQQHLYSSPSSLRFPGQWPQEEHFSPANDEPLPDAITVFTTIGWLVASVTLANLISLPRRFAQRFLRRQNIAAVPVIRDDGSNKKRLVDLGFADEPAALSPSAKARANLTRRHARQPATTTSSDFWYTSSEASSSADPSPSYEDSPMDIQSTEPVLESADDDDSLGFSFADVWTSPVLTKSPLSSPADESEDRSQNHLPAGQLSPTPADKLLNDPPLPTPVTSPVTRRPTPTLRPCSFRKCVLPRRPNKPNPLGSLFGPGRVFDGSATHGGGMFGPPGQSWRKDYDSNDPPRLLSAKCVAAWGYSKRDSSVKKEPPKLELPRPSLFGPPAPPKKMIPPPYDPQADLARKALMTRKPPSVTKPWTRLGQPLIIDPTRPPPPLCRTTPREKERYAVGTLQSSLKYTSSPTPVPKGPYAGALTARLGNPAWRVSKSTAITPMRRQLLKVQFNTQTSQEQRFSDPGTGLLNPTHSDEPATPSSSFPTNVPSSFETNVPAFSFRAHVVPSTPRPQAAPEDSLVYENDLSFLSDAPSLSPPPRKTVTWNKTLEEKKFYCDGNVDKMMQSVFQKIDGTGSPKASDAVAKEHKEPKQPKDTAEEQWQDTSYQSQEYEDDSFDAESGVSTADDNESNGVRTDALEHEDASQDSIFDEGSNISQLDEINEQSLDESEISMELLEEIRQGLENNLVLVPASVPVAKPLVSPLSTQEDDELEAAAEKASRSDKPEAHVVCKKLSLRDFGTLLPAMFNGNPRAWLNDNIVNEYLSILVNHKKKEVGFEHKSSGPAPPVHAFVSFWYQSQPASIARWAVKVQLGGSQYLEADLILYPICDNGHWRLLAVKPKARVIEYLDSLSYPGKKYVTKIKEYLQKQLGAEWVEDEWTVVELQNSTQQLNGSDCGVFTLLNALVLLRGEEPKRVLPDYGMEDARKRIATTLLAGQPTTEWD